MVNVTTVNTYYRISHILNLTKPPPVVAHEYRVVVFVEDAFKDVLYECIGAAEPRMQ